MEKKLSITYSEFVFVDYGILHAIHVCHVLICSLPVCTIFFHIIS